MSARTAALWQDAGELPDGPDDDRADPREFDCKFCGAVSCEGDCYEVRRWLREYEAAVLGTGADAANRRRLLTSPVGADGEVLW